MSAPSFETAGITDIGLLIEEREATAELLSIFTAAETTEDLIRRTTSFLKGFLKCHAIGIRLRSGEDYPYFETHGFPEKFVKAERRLCVYTKAGEVVRDADGYPILECMCGNVLCGRVDASQPFFTQHGSFWSNNTTQLLATTTDDDRQAHTRNRCNREGYESVGLFPVRYGTETLGLVQVNDKRTGFFTPGRISFLERFGDNLAIALSHHRTKEALIASEREFRLLAEAMPQIIWITDAEGGFLYFNRQWTDYTGLDKTETIGNGWSRPFHPDDRQRAWTAWQSALLVHEEYSIKCRLQRKDGVYRWQLIRAVPSFDEQGVLHKWFGTCTDIDEITKAEEALMVQKSLLFQSQKVQSIGTLAGGIAHDFNNILGIILGYTTMLEQRDMDDRQYDEYLNVIARTVDRGATLVQQILTYARKSNSKFEPLAVSRFIREMVGMLEETFPRTIVFAVRCAHDLPDIMADRTQMHQVLLNLAINARDAMPAGGTITITAELKSRDQILGCFPAASDESYLCLSVGDTGVGMDEATRLRVFDPFFTTKEQGKGTGLGLSVVYGIMQSHHGAIDVESCLGQGTTFTLFLPARCAPENTPDAAADASSPVVRGGNEMILLVEDEVFLRNLLVVMLESKGYRTMTAGDGEEAVEMFIRHRGTIDAVLTDAGLPKLSGYDEFKRMKAVDPGAKIIMASGFFEPALKEEMSRMGASGFIQKPYKPANVLQTLRDVLDATA